MKDEVAVAPLRAVVEAAVVEEAMVAVAAKDVVATAAAAKDAVAVATAAALKVVAMAEAEAEVKRRLVYVTARRLTRHLPQMRELRLPREQSRLLVRSMSMGHERLWRLASSPLMTPTFSCALLSCIWRRVRPVSWSSSLRGLTPARAISLRRRRRRQRTSWTACVASRVRWWLTRQANVKRW